MEHGEHPPTLSVGGGAPGEGGSGACSAAGHRSPVAAAAHRCHLTSGGATHTSRTGRSAPGVVPAHPGGELAGQTPRPPLGRARPPSTSAEPTITASANAADLGRLGAVDTPSPTPIGRSVRRRARSTSVGAVSRDGVAGAGDAHGRRRRRRSPRLAAAVVAIRSSVEDGATRKIGSRACAAAAASQPSASSGIRSGVIRPTPAGRGQVRGEALDAVALDRVPVGHDDRSAAPVAATASTTASTSRMRTPPRSAAVGGVLDDRAVQHRVGVGQADLDEVARRRRPWLSSLDGAGDRREAGRQVADQRGAALGARPSRARQQVGPTPGRSLEAVAAPASAGSSAAASALVTSGRRAEPARGGVHVLVAAAGEVDQDRSRPGRAPGRDAARRRRRARTRWPG